MLASLNREKIWLFLVGFTLCSFAGSERINSWGIIALGVFTLIDPKLISKLKSQKWHNKLWPMLAFFLVYFLFFLFSSRNGQALHALVSKLSFLLLPIFFFYENYFSDKNERLLFTLFSYALAIGLFYQISFSLYDNYFATATPNLQFALNRMTISDYLIHPGYYSAFLMTTILWHFFKGGGAKYFFITLFSIGIVLLLSRIYLLFYLLAVGVICIGHIGKSDHKLRAILIALIGGTALLFTMYQIPSIRARVNQTIQNINNTDKKIDIASATSSRRIAYEQEIKLVSQKPLLGYGLGNATLVLRTALVQSGYNALAADMKIHSQYINTWMQAGILGLTALLLMLFYNLRYFKTRHMQFATWLTIMISVALLTDDLLEIQANGVFFALLLSLFLCKRPATGYQ